MPFCPECKYEYNPGVATCPDCNVDLVAALPEEPEERVYENWIQLARFNSLQYARMLEQALREGGIPIVVQSGTGHFGHIGSTEQLLNPIGGGYSIIVPEEFIVKADAVALGMLGEEWESAKLIVIEGGDTNDRNQT